MLATEKGRLTLEESANILRSGGVIIFPTDTVYGVGCRFDDEEATKRIYKIKKKPKDERLPILVAEKYELTNLGCHVSDDTKSLINKYWPGGLTIIMKCNAKKIGLRMPNHPLARSLIKKTGVPLVGTSANFHEESSPGTFEEIDPDFLELVDGFLEGECLLKKESTVIDATISPPKILRQGAVKLDLSLRA